MEYIDRFYRNLYKTGKGFRFTIIEDESDIDFYLEVPHDFLLTIEDVQHQLRAYLLLIRDQLKDHIKSFPNFLTSLVPIEAPVSCPHWIKEMYEGALLAEVGPMACVAGAISETLGHYILSTWGDIGFFIENGGDIFLHTKIERKIQVFAGPSILSNKIAFKVFPEQSPMGICTSAGTVGPSLSFGKADAVVVVAKNTAIADAFATRLGNEVKDVATINKALLIAQQSSVIDGVIIIMGEHLGVWGNIVLA